MIKSYITSENQYKLKHMLDLEKTADNTLECFDRSHQILEKTYAIALSRISN